jgi:hypothetical protein
VRHAFDARVTVSACKVPKAAILAVRVAHFAACSVIACRAQCVTAHGGFVHTNRVL